MFQRITRSLAAPLALLIASIAAPPSRADFILYDANFNSSPSVAKVTSDGTISTFASGQTYRGVATDSTGDVYLSEYGSSLGHGVIQVLDPSGNSLPGYTNLKTPTSLAFDSQGDLFFTSGNGIEEIKSGSATPIPFSSSYATAQGLAIDSAGDVFVDTISTVVELDPSNKTVKNTFAIGLNIWGLAIDPITQNLFVAGYGFGGSVAEINPGATGGTVVQNIGGFSGSLQGLAFDSSGDLFIGNLNASRTAIYEVGAASVAAHTGTTDKTVFASGSLITQPRSLAVFGPQAPNAAAPEPSSLMLLGMGLASLAAYRWRRRRNA